MKRFLVPVALLSCLILIFSAGPVSADPIKNSLQENFPKLKFESVIPSPVKGIYEVHAGPAVLYYIAESQMLIFGQIITKDGRNLTRESEIARMAQKMKDVPLEKALKIVSGKITVIEFVDPECTFSRKAAVFLADKNELTRYVYFRLHNSVSEQKAKHIICSKDPAAAYKDTMAGRLDGKDAVFSACPGSEADELLKFHKEMTGRIGISGTPVIAVNGKIVLGANLAALEKFIKEDAQILK
jgi:thiol:disulfide interchange protein DsbC